MSFVDRFGETFPLMRPAVLLSIAIYHFVMTILEVIFVEWNPTKLLHVRDLRLKSFARLWKHNGETMSMEMPGPTFSLLASCTGVILDIGPGSGELLSRFDTSKISTIYGAEPAADLHPGLIRNAEKAGFGNRYKALLCGAEPESLIPALAKSGILGSSGTGGTAEDGIFDEVVCVRVLCGVPHPKETIQSLYTLLKPGGRMVISEHIANPWRTKGRLVARISQIVWSVLGWSFFMGGCELQRHTEEYLREAAGEKGWASWDLEYVGEDSAVPFVVGELRKKL